MIHYMPFTYIPDALFSTLAASLSPFTVFQPLRARVPAHMAEAAARNLIKLHCLSAVDQNALQQTLKELDAWAALHQRRPADLAAFFFDRAGSHAPLDEQTHQIRSTILQSGRAGQPPSALWQAALFLCLAHRYDEQQEMLQRTMRSVTALERQLDLFIGERGQEEGPPEPYLPASGRTATEDAGL